MDLEILASSARDPFPRSKCIQLTHASTPTTGASPLTSTAERNTPLSSARLSRQEPSEVLKSNKSQQLLLFLKSYYQSYSRAFLSNQSRCNTERIGRLGIMLEIELGRSILMEVSRLKKSILMDLFKKFGQLFFCGVLNFSYFKETILTCIKVVIKFA